MSPEYVFLLNKINKLSKSICCVASSLTPTTQMSLTSDTNGLMLVNDEDAPGNYQSYSTDGSGVKGWNSGIFGSGTTNFLPVHTNSNTVTTSRVNQYALGVGGLGVDDLITLTTTTNGFVGVFRNSYAGDASASATPMVLINSQSTSTTQKYLLAMTCNQIPTNSGVSMYLGRDTASRNVWIVNFLYIGNNITSNYIEEQFHSIPNLRRTYGSGNTTFGSGVTTDNGFRLEVDTSLKVGTKLNIGTPANPSIGTATLVGGTVTVNTTAVATGSKIFVSRNTSSGTVGHLSTPDASIVNGTSFVINSSSGTDTSTINWWIIN